jgi:hypothetical protein
MKPIFPKGWNPPPVVQTKRFLPVFERALTEAQTTHLMRGAHGWTTRKQLWPADKHAPLQKPWQCSSWAAVNAFQAFCRANGRGRWYAHLDAGDLHKDAQEIDGLEGGAAEVATTIQAAMEAICESANSGMREPWVVWAPVPLDLVGVWQDACSPVVADLMWPREWNHYSFIYKTLLYPHANSEKARHAVALTGHDAAKKPGFFRKRVRAFQVQDSEKTELIWIEARALAEHWNAGCGFMLASQREELLRMEKSEPAPAPMA